MEKTRPLSIETRLSIEGMFCFLWDAITFDLLKGRAVNFLPARVVIGIPVHRRKLSFVAESFMPSVRVKFMMLPRLKPDLFLKLSLSALARTGI